MKKILIMIMSCDDQFFINQEQIIKDTWLKKINDYDNIDYLIYRGDENLEKHSYNKENHLLLLRCEDDINNTFKKTYYAFNLIGKIFKDYDYIFRTNTSTYINIDLLNEFINRLDNDKILWCSELYSLSNAFCPYPLYLFGRGNGLILSKYLIDIILKEGKSFLYYKIHDDQCIGNILNSYWIKQNKNYLDYIKGYSHGWYKCINSKNDINHLLCQWGNDNKNWNFINKFITIQVRKYQSSRSEENQSLYELYEIFSNNEYENYDKILDIITNYSNNPSIFIGSTIGYMNYDKWITINKNNLFEFENSIKAPDDKNNLLKKWF